MSLLSDIIGFAYPRYCINCMRPADGPGKYICWECSRKMEFHASRGFCRICGKSFDSLPGGEFTCAECSDRPPAFDAARSAVHYKNPVSRMLIMLKYNKATYLKEDLACLLEACIARHYGKESIALLCPVPVHPRRLRERGYNQADELAKTVSSRMKIPVMSNALIRLKYTPSQTKLNADERRANIRGAFGVNPMIADALNGKTVLVVDDVMTTGATLNAAAVALKHAGAAKVIAATVARD